MEYIAMERLFQRLATKYGLSDVGLEKVGSK
jgi:hypothetical protein